MRQDELFEYFPLTVSHDCIPTVSQLIPVIFIVKVLTESSTFNIFHVFAGPPAIVTITPPSPSMNALQT